MSVAGFAAKTLMSEYKYTRRTNIRKSRFMIVHTEEIITTNYFIFTRSFTYFISVNPHDNPQVKCYLSFIDEETEA